MELGSVGNQVYGEHLQARRYYRIVKPGIDFTQLKKINIREYAIRFLFGGAVSILAELVTHFTTGRIGGIFTAFPAILLASLIIIGQHEGKNAAEDDARGGAIGAIALSLLQLD